MSHDAGKQLQVMAYRVDAERCWAWAMRVAAADSTCLRLPLRCPVVDDSLCSWTMDLGRAHGRWILAGGGVVVWHSQGLGHACSRAPFVRLA